MAADRRATSNDLEHRLTVPKKIESIEIGGDQYLVGIAGHEGPGSIFLDWFENGEWDEPLEPMLGIDREEEFEAAILGPEGLEIVDKFMRPYKIYDRWYAIGSGGAYALAVLEAGCGIEKAMETACRLDSGSGGGFDIAYLSGETKDVAPPDADPCATVARRFRRA